MPTIDGESQVMATEYVEAVRENGELKAQRNKLLERIAELEEAAKSLAKYHAWADIDEPCYCPAHKRLAAVLAKGVE